jgi:hypothetical protein
MKISPFKEIFRNQPLNEFPLEIFIQLKSKSETIFAIPSNSFFVGSNWSELLKVFQTPPKTTIIA